MPGIDALRAIAVLAVFLYHAGVGWMPGGFLGVDVFFAISGYVITSLLLAEYRRERHIKVGRFWVRRARRLLPAVGVFVATTMVVAAIAEPDRIDQLRGDAVASLAYFANWHFIFAQQPYFEQFQRPSLFRHLWSLSVEEQFYLFWPLLFAAGMSLLGRRRLLVGVAAGALASLALAWVLFDPTGDPSRVYYGTDTHAVGLLAGVALALVWSPSELRRRRAGRWSGPALDALGAVALAYVVLSFAQVHDYDLALWHGGYLWLALAAAVVIAAAAHPAARLGGLLGQPAVLWLGLRSYSFYLWHWPVLALTRPGVDVAAPRGLLIPLQLALSLILADLSYRFVELPFRGKGTKPALDPRTARPALLVGVVGIVALVGWGGVVGRGGTSPESAAASTASSAKVVARPGAAAGAGPARGARAAAKGPRVIALGDSVMIGAKDELAKRFGPSFSLDAHVSRQVDDVIAIARRLKRSGARPQALIIQVGNNGPLYGDEMAALRAATSNADELFLVNDYAPVSWEGQANHALEEADKHWPRTELIDWHSLAASRKDLTWDDTHLTPTGARLYAKLIAHAVRGQGALGAGRRQR